MKNMHSLEVACGTLLKSGPSQIGGERLWDCSESGLWYLCEEQATSWLNLVANSEAYAAAIPSAEEELLLATVDAWEPPAAMTIIDLGAGDGSKFGVIAEHLKERTALTYCPLDINPLLLKKAAAQASSRGIPLSASAGLVDFADLIAWRRTYTPSGKSLFLLLGNTFGDFPETSQLPLRLAATMAPGDELLVGNALDNGYDWTEAYADEHIDAWLRHIPHALGLPDSHIRYGARFRAGRIEEYYVVTEATGRFQRNDLILTAISAKYTPEEFCRRFNDFSSVSSHLNDDASYGLFQAVR